MQTHTHTHTQTRVAPRDSGGSVGDARDGGCVRDLRRSHSHSGDCDLHHFTDPLVPSLISISVDYCDGQPVEEGREMEDGQRGIKTGKREQIQLLACKQCPVRDR